MEPMKFYRSNLVGYETFDEPGRFTFICANNVTDKHLVYDPDGQNPRYIVNFKAIPPDKVKEVAALFMENEEVDVELVKGMFLTHSIYVNDKPDIILPIRGEKIECIVDKVLLRDGTEALRIVTATLRERAKSQKFDMSIFFSPPTERSLKISAEEEPHVEEINTEAQNEGISIQH